MLGIAGWKAGWVLNRHLHLPVEKVDKRRWAAGGGRFGGTGSTSARILNHPPLLPPTHPPCVERMLGRLKGLSDPEAKRKAIGAEFIDVFRCGSEKGRTCVKAWAVPCTSLNWSATLCWSGATRAHYPACPPARTPRC